MMCVEFYISSLIGFWGFLYVDIRISVLNINFALIERGFFFRGLLRGEQSEVSGVIDKLTF